MPQSRRTLENVEVTGGPAENIAKTLENLGTLFDLASEIADQVKAQDEPVRIIVNDEGQNGRWVNEDPENSFRYDPYEPGRITTVGGKEEPGDPVSNLAHEFGHVLNRKPRMSEDEVIRRYENPVRGRRGLKPRDEPGLNDYP